MSSLKLTDAELELAILAVETYRREHLADYDEEDRPQIGKELNALALKLRHT